MGTDPLYLYNLGIPATRPGIGINMVSRVLPTNRLMTKGSQDGGITRFYAFILAHISTQ